MGVLVSHWVWKGTMNSLSKNQNFFVGLSVAMLGALIYFIVLPSQLETAMDDGSVTPALMPKLAAGAITLLGFLMVLTSLFGHNFSAEKKLPRLTLGQIGRVVAAVFIMALYLVGMEWLGFLVATPVFALGFMLFLGARKLWVMALMAAALTAATYFTFYSFVGVPLPMGIFFE